MIYDCLLFCRVSCVRVCWNPFSNDFSLRKFNVVYFVRSIQIDWFLFYDYECKSALGKKKFWLALKLNRRGSLEVEWQVTHNHGPGVTRWTQGSLSLLHVISSQSSRTARSSLRFVWSPSSAFARFQTTPDFWLFDRSHSTN